MKKRLQELDLESYSMKSELRKKNDTIAALESKIAELEKAQEGNQNLLKSLGMTIDGRISTIRFDENVPAFEPSDEQKFLQFLIEQVRPFTYRVGAGRAIGELNWKLKG